MFTASEGGFLNPQEFWSQFVQPRIAHIQNVSPLNSTNLVRDARQTLDDELDALHLAMCQLRKRRNALSLVSCLPPETVVYIFKFVANAMPPQRQHEDQTALLGWIGVTHVCTHWRDTALLHPSLWGKIDDNVTLRWREVMIARAKSAPLSICLEYGYRYSPNKAFFVRHTSHTRELHLSARPSDLQDLCQSLTCAAPILEHLDFQGSGKAMMNLPADFLHGDTPSLRRITLEGVSFPWSASVFRNLTDLRVKLSHSPGVTRARDSERTSQYDHLLGALARMPSLRMLELVYCLPSRIHHPIGHVLVVLPHLKLLSLAGTLGECIGIAEHLTIPSSSRIILKCPRTLQQTDPGLARFLETHISRGTIPPLLTLSISLTGQHGTRSELVTVELWRTCTSSDAVWPDFCPNRWPFISISFPLSPDSLGPLEGICSVLPLEDLRVLKIDYNHNSWSPEAWIKLFGRCRLVEHVSVAGCNVEHFCKALVLPASGGAGTVTGMEDLFFRHLISLHVCKVDLLASVEDEGDQHPFNDSLNDWLSARKDLIMEEREDTDDDEYHSERDENSGDNSQDGQVEWTSEKCKLERLVITKCSITQEHMENLGEYVQHVFWDEDKGVYKEEDSEEEDVDDYYMY